MTSVKLTSLGFGKLLKQVDEKIAAKATQLVRPLTNKFVENHLNDVGLEPEFASHSRIGALSGGQKVKVVLAAAMWNTPHIVELRGTTSLILQCSRHFLMVDTLNGLQVLNRAMPENLSVEKKTITGRTFKRG